MNPTVLSQTISDMKCVSFDEAVVCGINYFGSSMRLSNCINDAKAIASILKEVNKAERVRRLIDTRNSKLQPTCANILSCLGKMLKNENNETCFYSYSGHGTYVPDKNNDETDGKDEAIVPVDCSLITDDVFYNMFNSPENKVKVLFTLFDSCHSGSVVDLPYSIDCDMNTYVHSKHEPLNVNDDRTTVICLSAAKDSEYASDSTINFPNNGALTGAFIYTIRLYGFSLTYEQLLTSISNVLYDAHQTAILSSNKPLDVKNFFLKEGKFVVNT
ncbi:hypothetical protein [Heterosigma akashiwo virus 01]|uniref:Peptidase C14 caspase domain-containing protein n=1 Tax=Heterosigma akashiwo virus 01 TaxID=97195 RepID=A0A1C9C552_HAV01|nr:hypothetical protein D1R72_gp083 [Heterosigma akashiwo virus 01]AOM63414.1 hypothetical protein [Heterosigma akashiwo virus 01]